MEYVLPLWLTSGLAIFSIRNKIIIYAICSFLIIFSGLRFETGNDWGEYKKEFNEVPVATFGELLKHESRVESSFIYLSYIAKCLSLDLESIFFLYALITIGLISASAYKYTPFVALALLLYMRYGFLQHNFMFMRQGLAISIVFYAFRFVLTKEFYKYVVFVLFASLFHVSAIILLPIFWINKEYNPLVYLATLIISLIIGQFRWLDWFALNFIPEGNRFSVIREYVFSESWGVKKIISFSYFEKLFIFCFFFYFRKGIAIKNKYFYLFFNLSFLSLLISLVFLNYVIFVDRLNVIFNISYIILLTYTLFAVKKDSRIFVNVCFVCFVCFWFFSYVSSDPVYLPYKNALFLVMYK